MAVLHKKEKQPYIGGAFASGDDEVYFSGSSDFNEQFPLTVRGVRRALFETGSDAIAHAVRSFAKKCQFEVPLWLPRNFCRATVRRILLKCRADVTPAYYQAVDDIDLEKPCAVLFLHFNKFDPSTSDASIGLLNREDVLVIEDFVQAPFDIAKTIAPCAVASLRKISTVEAAIAYMPENSENPAFGSPYLALKREAMDLRQRFFETGDKSLEIRHLEAMDRANAAEMDSRIYLVDDAGNFNPKIDFSAIRERRTINCAALKESLRNQENLKILPSEYFFLMIETPARNAMREQLFSKGIFAPIHWADAGDEAAKNLISLPVDQRYDREDMQRIADTIIRSLSAM